MSDIKYVMQAEQELADKQEEIERLDKYCNEIIVGYDKEIERLNGLVLHQQELERKAITKEYEQDKEIERLRKEKEWLLNELLPVYVRDIPGIHKPEISKESLRDLINIEMQQALKEGE